MTPHEANIAAAKATIQKGSKSFAAAARLFNPAMRADAVLLYAWCRYCDDIIDGQDLGFASGRAEARTPAERLAALRAETAAALAGSATDPIFIGVADVMRRHAIPARYALDHLEGFAMDVAGRRYWTLEDTLSYCYGVAGVVGLMMAYIMGMRDRAVLQRACDLGLAFQLTNIARDIVEDAAVGRIYCPETWLQQEGVPIDAMTLPAHRASLARVARRLVAEADVYYASAAIGIQALPVRAAWAIATASSVYRAIGTEIVRRGAAAWDTRVSTSAGEKLSHVVKGGARALAGSRRRREPLRDGLWTPT